MALGRPIRRPGPPRWSPRYGHCGALYVGHGIATRRAADEDLLAARRLVLRSVAAAVGRAFRRRGSRHPTASSRSAACVPSPRPGGRRSRPGRWRSRRRGGLAPRARSLGRTRHLGLGARDAPGVPPPLPAGARAAPRSTGRPAVHPRDRTARVRLARAPRARGLLPAHGKRFCRREATLEEWTRRAREFADGYLESSWASMRWRTPGPSTRSVPALHRDLGDQLRAAWRDGRPAEFVGVEVIFGAAAALPLAVGGGRTLWVQGSIDRLERTAGGLVLRDVKTGSARSARSRASTSTSRSRSITWSRPRWFPAPPSSPRGYIYSVRAGDAERLFAGEDLRHWRPTAANGSASPPRCSKRACSRTRPTRSGASTATSAPSVGPTRPGRPPGSSRRRQREASPGGSPRTTSEKKDAGD